MTAPLVSVLVPAYRQTATVERTLASVVDQDLPGVELLVSDDGSGDGTADVIRRWCAEHVPDAVLDLRERNLGLCASLNRLLDRAGGRYVCVLDGDDWYEPGALRSLSAALDALDDGVAVVYGDAHVVDAGGRLLRPSFLAASLGGAPPPQGDMFAVLQVTNVLFVGAVMVRRSALVEVGAFDESLMFQDWDLWLRLADRYAFAHVDATVVNRRVLPTSMEHSMFGTRDMQRSVARLQAKWLGRDERARRTAARWIRRSAAVLAAIDRTEARTLLGQVRDVPADDRIPWRVVEASLRVPGSGRLWPPTRAAASRARALVEAEAGAWRAGRRLPRPRTRESRA